MRAVLVFRRSVRQCMKVCWILPQFFKQFELKFTAYENETYNGIKDVRVIATGTFLRHKLLTYSSCYILLTA